MTLGHIVMKFQNFEDKKQILNVPRKEKSHNIVIFRNKNGIRFVKANI